MPAIERVTMTDKPNETIIEFSADGRIERAQVEDAMRQLDEAMDRGDTVHVFAEIRNFSGMSWEAWRSDLGNAIRYLTRLRQFGRLAVVSDQSRVALSVTSNSSRRGAIRCRAASASSSSASRSCRNWIGDRLSASVTRSSHCAAAAIA